MATVKILPLKHRKLKGDFYPIYVRVIHERVKKEYSLGLKCSNDDFDFVRNKFKRNAPLNKKLLDHELKAIKIINSLSDDFNFELFECEYLTKKNSVSIYMDMSNLVDQLNLEDRLGSARTYTNTLNSFSKFINTRQYKFDQLMATHISKYLDYMMSKGLSKATIGIYLRTLKAAYNKTTKPRHEHPFDGIKIPTGKKGKVSLSKEEIIKLYSFKTDNPITRRSIDWFILSYLCRGMNFSDMVKLKYGKDVSSQRIEYLRSKTLRTSLNDNPISIQITPDIESIIARYKNKDSDYVLPVLDDGLTVKSERYRIHRHLKIINKQLKEVGKEIGILGFNKITFYCARHSYANSLSTANVNINTISKGLGHTSIRTTMNYLSSIQQDVLDESDKLLL